MSNSDCVGLQVVKLSQNPDQRYEVDEEALARVLLRAEVRHLPVVVVSVAGAYRGGKSFILDFFLRYLTAPRSSQLSGEWLGSEDDLLEGFDWRGGGESNTKGIHLWPEPVIVTIERTGEKVAVLLMDTQGTFDTECDMNDNSAIFALSTLLSSVQIYNLRANIGEDDLQHLQLFTEYGRLACLDEERAFQTIKFLIRDWLCPYEHPYGYEGGKKLLEKRLQIKSNQRQQLQEVRQHIHSCFEKLECFLMPHPGLAVINPNFRGRLGDITEDFKTSLLQLVPSLFTSDNLTLKIINGERIQAQDLLEYFKQYVNVFNSDLLPQAATIFQATIDACVISSLRQARQKYEDKMEAEMTEGESVSNDMMQEWHNDAVTVSLNYFRERNRLGSQKNIEKHWKNFEKELNARLSQLLWQNENYAKNAISSAMKTYKDTMDSIWKLQERLCLHPNDLEAEHHQAFLVTLFLFQQNRPRVPQEQDVKRNILIEDLKQYYQNLCLVNEKNNKMAALEARELYISRMRQDIKDIGETCLVLENRHETILEEALQQFLKQRNYNTDQTNDSYIDNLKQDIDKDYEDFKTINMNNRNTWAIEEAFRVYNDKISSEWYDQVVKCMHPSALHMLHMRARNVACQEFDSYAIGYLQDFKTELIERLEARFTELQTINEINNSRAVNDALDLYKLLMRSEIPTVMLAMIPVLLRVAAPVTLAFQAAPLLALLNKDLNSRKSSLKKFIEMRCGVPNDTNDEYLEDLKKKISSASFSAAFS